MVYPQNEILLKDGRTALLRSPVLEDAGPMLAVLSKAASETPFLLSSPEDPKLTLEQELAFIKKMIASENDVMILCIVDGEIAGTCQIGRGLKQKTRHRGRVAIALLQMFWNLGIGTALFRELIQIARNWKLEQIELDFIEGNDRARALYEKMGFQVFSQHPNAVHLSNGAKLKEYGMLLVL